MWPIDLDEPELEPEPPESETSDAAETEPETVNYVSTQPIKILIPNYQTKTFWCQFYD